MKDERWQEIERLYSSALERRPEERATWLHQACSDDSLRREVESLLACQSEAKDFIESPALEAAAKVVTEDSSPAPGLDLVGRTLLHYRILGEIGQGGMGEVFLAEDTSLNRRVAVKFLSPEMQLDTVAHKRLLREAHAAAALDHPYICSIHEVAQCEGQDFIVMEYVDGQTLKDRLAQGPLPLNEAIQAAGEVAEALEEAHDKRIVHRDLKPANIMLTSRGHAKVMDFGLAKQLILPGGITSQEESVTALTRSGMTLGTLAYMSPEQLRGEAVDPRSDIFSFGVVLYEMLAGVHPFKRETGMDTASAILNSTPPPLAELRPDIPGLLQHVVKKTLAKDPHDRYALIQDVRIDLKELQEGASKHPEAERRQPRWWLWAAAPGAVLLLAAVLFWWLKEPPTPADLRPVALTSYPGIEAQPTFSPDGNKVAFVWNGEKEDNYDIYVKQIGSAGPPMRLTTSPSVDSCPAWSPDDRWIAFTRVQQGNAAIMVIPPLGGPERKLTEMSRAGLSWTAEGVVAASYGALSWTADGKWLVFGGKESPKETLSIWAIAVATGERRRLTTSQTMRDPYLMGDCFPSISPDGGTLAFARHLGEVFFELCALRLTRDLQPVGKPWPITTQRYSMMQGLAWSTDGREIVYTAGEPASLWRIPVSGQRIPKPLTYALPSAIFPAIARAPSRLAYTWRVLNTNLWRLDTRTGERRMLIGSTYVSFNAQYSPDGRKIAFTSNRSGNLEVWTCDAEGSNCLQLTSFGGPRCGSPSWSPDGCWLALDSRSEGQPEIYVMPADGGTPRRVTNHGGNTMPNWSRDGRWIYFASNRTGQYDVWKVPKDGGEEVQITRSGGNLPLESPDGRYLYFSKVGRKGLFRMPVEGGEEVKVLPTGGIVGATAKGIYWFAQNDKTIQLLDTVTGKVSALATLEKSAVWGGLTVSPDGAYVVWGQTDRDTVDLMLVEGFR